MSFKPATRLRGSVDGRWSLCGRVGLWERPREKRRTEEALLQWEEEASVSRWLVAWEKLEEGKEMGFYIIYGDYL